MNQNNWRAANIYHPELHHGEPCIRGTRMPVSILVASLADFGIDDLLREFPQLTREDIQAAIYYASEAVHPSPRKLV